MKNFFLFAFFAFLLGCQKPEISEKILFNSNRNGNSDIFLLNTDGSNVQTVVNSSFDEWGAVFIDAQSISFLRQVNDSIKRFNFNVITQEEVEIPQLGVCYLDDKNVVYSKNGDYVFSCNVGLFLKKKDESIFRALSTGTRNTPNYLSWSFDGKSVLYTDDLMGNNDIYSIDINTSQIKNLTNSPSNDERGDLSPDGNFLVFSSNRHDKSDQDIFILNLKTREVENISQSSGSELIGRWSLDGKSIFYGSDEDGNWELYKYNLVDKSTKRLTVNNAFDGDARVR